MIEPKIYRDDRGSFQESWHAERYEMELGGGRFVQDNLSRSKRGVVRGLHFQNPRGQAKLVTVLAGAVYDVIVDVRVGSPTFGQWEGFHLVAEESKQLFIPSGFAHGFAALTDEVVFSYKCSDYYAPKCEATLLWNDPDLGIDWPIEAPILSEKDEQGMRLADFPKHMLPRYPILRGGAQAFVVAVL
ncbi:MAG: dTDP-4-dehydrorhamnose 3,5-epimerase [Isosphaeraceae bacterium]|nr:dTDP-4-dehydrorhamnose 3,5-epimerase [Isosphaeraceae bacterium]